MRKSAWQNTRACLSAFVHVATAAHVTCVDTSGLCSSLHRKKIAKALATNAHRTWTCAVDGLKHWRQFDQPGMDGALHHIGISVGDRNKINRALNQWGQPKPEPPNKCIARVRLGQVDLKLTLTAKFLAKPFGEAVLTPFLKVYNKKMDTETTIGDIEEVNVTQPRVKGFRIVHDETFLDDLAAPTSEYLKVESATLTVELKPQPPSEGETNQAAPAADCSASVAPRLATGEEVEQPGERSEDHLKVGHPEKLVDDADAAEAKAAMVKMGVSLDGLELS